MSTTALDTPALYPPTVPGLEKPLGRLRFLLTFIDNPIRTLPVTAYEQPYSVRRLGERTIVWLSDPALIERVLLKEADSFPKTPVEARVFGRSLGKGILVAEGAEWRWQRKAAAPAFRHSELLASIPEMSAAAEAQVQRWRAHGGPFDAAIDDDMMDATFDVIARTVLGGCGEATAEAIKRGGHDFLEPISWEVGFAVLGIPAWVWHPAKRKLRRAASRSRAAVTDLLRKRLADPAPRNDLLAKLIAAKHPDSGEPMPEDRLVDNLSTFLMAGHETTAKALTWTLYLLARSPEWQQRIRTEVSAVAGNEQIGAGHLAKLPVTQMVLKESMRLYPPAPVMSRMTTAPADLNGENLPAGAMLVVPIYAVHRHKALWDDPDRFDPQRFTPEQEAARPRAQYMPFGYGPRTCIGASFAMMEATVLLATFIRAARFDWDGKLAPEPVSRVTLRPKGGMRLRVTAIG